MRMLQGGEDTWLAYLTFKHLSGNHQNYIGLQRLIQHGLKTGSDQSPEAASPGLRSPVLCTELPQQLFGSAYSSRRMPQVQGNMWLSFFIPESKRLSVSQAGHTRITAAHTSMA